MKDKNIDCVEELLKTHFPTFIRKSLSTTDPAAQFLPNWHIDLIAEDLEAAQRGEITRLIINMPPRALKSQCVSIAWPAWLLGHDPRARIIVASYSQSLALRHSIDTRAVMTSDWYQYIFPKTKLTHDQNEKHKFMTTKRGFRFATSVGGTLTGEGGHFLILDDPLNPAQAASRHMREHAARWYDHTLSTRLNDKKRGVIVLVMQRLHQDDLTAHLLEKGGFTHLCLPSVATSPEFIQFGRVTKHREIGDLLHPAREDEALIERAKRELGAAVFSAQYQQQPFSEENSAVKRVWFLRYDTAPGKEESTRVVQSWDTAIKAESHHDASVCLTFHELGNVSYLVDVCVVRYEYPELKKRMKSLAATFDPHAILIEDKASGQQLLQDLRRETSLPIVAVKTNKDKETRFHAITALIEAGRLSLPKNAPWLAAFEQEILEFPHGRHDDQVDALTQYLDSIRRICYARIRVRSL